MKYLTVFKLLQFRPGELLITAYYSVDQRYSKLDYKFIIKIRKNIFFGYMTLGID